MGSKLKVFLTLFAVCNLVFLFIIIGLINQSGGLRNVLSSITHSSASKEITPYYLQRNSLFEKLTATEGGIVFLGDSITNFGEWNEFFSQSQTKNRGIAGDTTKGVINRLDPIIQSKPEKVFIMIGINDLRYGRDVSEVVKNYTTILESIQSQSPNTKIYMESVLPVHPNKFAINYPQFNGERMNTDVVELNKQLELLAHEHHIPFLDIYSILAKGKELDSKYTIDGIHLTGEAYEVWIKTLRTYVE